MSLMSEERIILHGREQANLTLVYPTLVGKCNEEFNIILICTYKIRKNHY
jgi:hypothetical protein